VTLKRTNSYNTIILKALKMVNIGDEIDGPTAYQLETARDAFSDILDSLESRGTRIFRREWRTRTFQPASLSLVAGETYECYRSHTSINASTWTSATAIVEGQFVYPTTYNGMYYEAQGDGTTGGTEPTFEIDQDSQTTDNDIVWVAYPDNKPGVGKAWIKYWVKSGVDGTTWAINTSYRAAGTFELLDDEIEILKASVKYGNEDPIILDIITDSDYASIGYLNEKGTPSKIYIATDGLYSNRVELFPNPDQTGTDGYVLHYLVNKRGMSADTGTTDVDVPDNWFLCLQFMLASMLCFYFQIDAETAGRIDRKAEQLYKSLMRVDLQLLGSEGVTPCW
jgi:hypothetical protein